jgi:molecular chaperone GrpE
VTDDKKKLTHPEKQQEIPSDTKDESKVNGEAEIKEEDLQEELPAKEKEEALPEGDLQHVTIPLKDYASQLKQMDLFKAMADEFKDGWQRERAEFSNYRKLVEKYLVILDDLERAIKTRPADGPAKEWSNGIELIVRKLQGILDCEGVKRIPAEKESFDPARHEAISHEESPDHKSGQIIEVVQQGYTIGDRVLRPAQVRVAR